jgi:SAM-dependent methyltransferase
MRKGSLPGWNFFRRAMTGLGHALTRHVLGLPYDASGAFRAYQLDRIPREVFGLVRSNGYSFFFESLFVLFKNAFCIRDVPIVLPARTYGSSKMTAAAALRSGRFVFELAVENLRHPEQFLLPPPPQKLDPTLCDPQNWDGYWNRQAGRSGVVYDLIAAAYRQTFIKSNIERTIFDTFREGSRLLHAGCGSGQADTSITRKMQVTALDISPGALRLYSRNNGTRARTVHGSILALPFGNESFDGYYNMGVVEHFPHQEIVPILREAARVLKPDGKLVIFWPHRRATSVFVLGLWHRIAHALGRRNFSLHPPEVSLTRGPDEAECLLREAGLRMCAYHFGPRDLFVQAVVVAEKPAS